MQLSISPGTSIPIAEQIRAQLAGSIAALELRSGDVLTPAGELAEQLVTSPTTVLKAYRALESEGLCRRSERGFEVAPATHEQRLERARTRQVTVGSQEALLADLDLARRIQSRPPRTT